MKKRREQGFTLIEIIVSIAIASIVLMLIGTIILTSSNLLISSGQSDLDKRIGDSVIDFVRSEIQYSSDVRLVKPDSQYAPSDADKEDNDWHSIYVKDGKLYRDGKSVFNEEFYSQRILEMTCQGNYENSQRLDIKYLLSDTKETKYSTRDTVILLNFSASDEIKKNGLYTSEYKSLSQDSGKDGYVIYYNKKYNAPSGQVPDRDLTGTVADIIQNIYWGNCKGMYDGAEAYNYANGEIVWYNGSWWQNISFTDNSEPGKGYGWKRLNKNYTHINSGTTGNKECSGYETGDIVVYNGYYYQAKSNITDNYHADINEPENKSWERLGAINNDTTIESVKKQKYPQKKIYIKNNVISKYLKDSSILQDPSRKSIPIYSDSKTYNIGDIVRVKNWLDITKEYYDLYIKQIDIDKKIAPGYDTTSGWVKIDIRFDDKRSSYAKGDIVLFSGDNRPWIIAQNDVLKITNPATDIYNPGTSWKRYTGE